jgi:hypothetical protein
MATAGALGIGGIRPSSAHRPSPAEDAAASIASPMSFDSD